MFLLYVALSLFCVSALVDLVKVILRARNRYQEWRQKVHEVTVIRFYMTETTANVPEIEFNMDGCSIDELIGTVGALEAAKSIILSRVPLLPKEQEVHEDEDLEGGE